jgi:hypothetical protein
MRIGWRIILCLFRQQMKRKPDSVFLQIKMENFTIVSTIYLFLLWTNNHTEVCHKAHHIWLINMVLTLVK